MWISYISYNDDKYKDLINNSFNYKLKEKDLHLMEIDNLTRSLEISSIDT